MSTKTVVAAAGSAVESGRAVIVCKYHGPTDHRGARISVNRQDRHPDGGRPDRIWLSWDYSVGIHENMTAAVQAYIDRMGWSGVWSVGLTADGAVAVYQPGSGY